MSIAANKLTAEQYEKNFSDIHPPFETQDAALVEANRCLFAAIDINTFLPFFPKRGLEFYKLKIINCPIHAGY